MICLFFGGRLATNSRKGQEQIGVEEGTEFCKQKVEVTYLECEDESIKEEVGKSRTGN